MISSHIDVVVILPFSHTLDTKPRIQDSFHRVYKLHKTIELLAVPMASTLAGQVIAKPWHCGLTSKHFLVLTAAVMSMRKATS